MSNFGSRVCRPQVLTCRWLQEITKAIHELCPRAPVPIQQCDNVESMWREYLFELGRSRCSALEDVRQILTYEKDYNETLKRSGR